MHTLQHSHSEAVILLKHLEVCLPECCRQMLLPHPGRIVLPLQGKQEELESRFTAVDVAALKSRVAAQSSLFTVLALGGVWLENRWDVGIQSCLAAWRILPFPFVSNFFAIQPFITLARHRWLLIPSVSEDSISLGTEALLCAVPQDFIFSAQRKKRWRVRLQGIHIPTAHSLPDLKEILSKSGKTHETGNK